MRMVLMVSHAALALSLAARPEPSPEVQTARWRPTHVAPSAPSRCRCRRHPRAWRLGVGPALGWPTRCSWSSQASAKRTPLPPPPLSRMISRTTISPAPPPITRLRPRLVKRVRHRVFSPEVDWDGPSSRLRQWWCSDHGRSGSDTKCSLGFYFLSQLTRGRRRNTNQRMVFVPCPTAGFSVLSLFIQRLQSKRDTFSFLRTRSTRPPLVIPTIRKPRAIPRAKSNRASTRLGPGPLSDDQAN
jgi:hypothetical protein